MEFHFIIKNRFIYIFTIALFCGPFAKAELLDETIDLVDQIEEKYLTAISAPPKSSVYKQYDALLRKLKANTSKIGKIQGKSKLLEVKEANVYANASKLSTLYKSALRKQSTAVVDSHVSEGNKFLAGTDNERDRKFALCKLKDGLATLKIYKFPDLALPYSNNGEKFSRDLRRFLTLAIEVELEYGIDTVLNKMESSDRQVLYNLGGSMDYLTGNTYNSYYRKIGILSREH